eukprot:jgi/Tetstr1/462684/TSEL_007650.t1
MGVGEDPVGEDGMAIDAPAWPPADVEAADEGVIRKGDPGDFYMKVIAKKFRGVWHYGVITGVVTDWVLEDYGGATQWRAVFEDGDIVDLLRSEVSGPGLRSGKVTVQSGWVMEDCLHHMETFSILNAGPLFEEARNVVTEEDGPERKAQVDALTREGRTRDPASAAPRRGGWGSAAPRRGGRGSAAPTRVGWAGQRLGKMTVQSGWVMEDCLHHMETFSILNAGPLFEEARNVVTEEDGPERKAQVDALTREGRTRDPANAAPRRGGWGSAAPRRGGRGSAAPTRVGWAGQRLLQIVCSSNAAFPV